EYDRPERPERERFRDGPRGRPDDRRAPRYESRERFERPQRFAERREERPLRVAAPVAKSPRPEKPPAAGAPVSDPVRPLKVEPSQLKEKSSTPPEVKSPAEVKPEVQKTYSDAEILASVKPEPRKPASSPPGKSAPPWVRREHSEEKAIRPPKKGRPPAGDFTRLHMNLGEAMGVVPIDIVNAIAGETGLPGKVVGNVDIRERHLFVDVASDHANAILAKLNRTQIKGHKIKVKAA
ncbi:MAG: DbpA RNA binding domain-containing protein, partial [Verrucomicrobiia bacterium]